MVEEEWHFTIPGHTVPERFDVEEEWGAGVEEWGTSMEEEWGAGVETCIEDVEEGMWSRRTRRMWRRSGCRQVFSGEMIGLGFRGSGTLKKKNSSNGHDDVINAHRYIWIINARHCYGYACRYCDYDHRYKFKKNRV
jgi:hypothetical protein